MGDADTELFEGRMLLGLHLDRISDRFGQSPNHKKDQQEKVSDKGAFCLLVDLT